MRGPAAAHEILCDRLHVAVKTALLVGGRPVSPVLVLVGAGLEFHHSRDAMAAQVPAIEELIANKQLRGVGCRIPENRYMRCPIATITLPHVVVGFPEAQISASPDPLTKDRDSESSPCLRWRRDGKP